MTYQEACDRVAKRHNWDSFELLIRVLGYVPIKWHEEIAKLYADGKCEEQRKLCGNEQEGSSEADWCYNAPTPKFD
jgi:hypothetical protein